MCVSGHYKFTGLVGYDDGTTTNCYDSGGRYIITMTISQAKGAYLAGGKYEL